MTELDIGDFPSQLCMVTTRKHHCAALKCTPLLIINTINLLGCCQVHRLMCKIKWECFCVPWVIQVTLRENKRPGDNSNSSLKGIKWQQLWRGGWAGCGCFPPAESNGLGWAVWESPCCYTPNISVPTETGQLSPQASGRWQWHIFDRQSAATGKRYRRLQGKNFF